MGRLILCGAVTISALVGLSLSATASERVFIDEVPDSATLIDALSPQGESEDIEYRGVPEHTYRGLVIESPPSEPDQPDAERELEPEEPTVTIGQPERELPTVTLAVQFAFDSAKLTERARFLLDEVGKAMTSSQLEQYFFLLEGHTDGIGPLVYNIDLSERRANSVREYLIRSHSITPERLEIRGHGPRFPLEGADPEDAVNRRVEITNVGRL